MDYEKKYKEALEKAHKLCAYPISKPFISDLQDLFPELKESEDERIRKALIHLISEQDGFLTEINGVSVKDIIAWLEKQGENTYNKELSELLHKVICRFINDPNIPYTEREKVSMEIIPYVERLEKQGEQQDANIQINPSEYINDMGGNGCYLKNTAQTSAWSEEDENGLSDALWCCKQAASIAKDENDMGNLWCAERWLKSLKPQNRWKPSEEQIKALKETVDEHFDIDGGALWHLYQELKNLKE